MDGPVMAALCEGYSKRGEPERRLESGERCHRAGRDVKPVSLRTTDRIWLVRGVDP